MCMYQVSTGALGFTLAQAFTSAQFTGMNAA
jgi:hypothetical protein